MVETTRMSEPERPVCVYCLTSSVTTWSYKLRFCIREMVKIDDSLRLERVRWDDVNKSTLKVAVCPHPMLVIKCWLCKQMMVSADNCFSWDCLYAAFKNYILLIMLLQLSQFFPFPQAIPIPLFLSMGHRYKFVATLFPILYCASPWLFCNYLFVHLNPLTSSPIPPHTLPSGNHQNVLGIYDSVSVLVCLVCFLDSSVDRYVFIDILSFMVLIFFLNKSL